MESKNIYQKLLEAQRQLPCLVKEKAKSDGLKYAFVSHDEVTTEAKKVFDKLGLLCLSTVDSSSFNEVEVEKWDYKANGLKKAVNTYCTLNITVKIVNVDYPEETIETKAVGQGIDEGDKATGKAYSYAFKYALLKLLMAETAEDSDNDQQTTKLPKENKKITPYNGDKQGLTSAQIKAKIADIKKTLNNSSDIKTLSEAWEKTKNDRAIIRNFDEQYHLDIDKFKNDLKEEFLKIKSDFIDDAIPDFNN